MSQSHFDSFEKYLPYYLSKERKEGLILELNNFPEISTYYLSQSKYKDEVLQGDIVSEMDLYTHEPSQKIKTHGIILSNSCDISPDNDRYKQVYVTFCPIVSLQKFKNLVEKAGKDFTSIELDLKNQKISDLFYLPQEASLPEDHIALFSQSYSIPYEKLNISNKKFSLSQAGFYMFLFKLSIHYCRFHEGVDRH